MAKKKLNKFWSWTGLIALIVLAIIPVDPTDVLDFGTPILEIIGLVLDLKYGKFK